MSNKLQIPNFVYTLIENVINEKNIINNKKQVGRPFNQDLKSLINGILYVLKTGIAWSYLPKEYGSYITVYKYFNKFSNNEVFEDTYKRLLKIFHHKIDIRKQYIDCSMIKNKKGSDCIGKNHYDRFRSASKISMITDKNGIPLAIDLHPANIHDSNLFFKTINNFLIKKDTPSRKKPQYFIADKGYDYNKIRYHLSNNNYCIRIPKRKSKYKIPPKLAMYKTDSDRNTIERCFSWIKNYKRLNIRYDKEIKYYKSFLFLSLSDLVYKKFI